MIAYLKDRTQVQPNGCILWTLSTNRGYARARFDGKMQYVHRVLWEQTNGPVPEGHDVDHTCHNHSDCNGGVDCVHRRCVNLDHLECVTKKVNQNRGRQRDHYWNKTHCPQGHPYDDENTYWYTNVHGNPARTCKACKMDRQRKYRSSK